MCVHFSCLDKSSDIVEKLSVLYIIHVFFAHTHIQTLVSGGGVIEAHNHMHTHYSITNIQRVNDWPNIAKKKLLNA